MGNSEYKERENSLENAREKIEDYMQIFKEWEREAKIKAFSREGLAADKIDKKKEEKIKTGIWLNELLGNLNFNKDALELEEKAGKKKNNEISHTVSKKLEEMKIQITRIEIMLRSLENEYVNSEQLNDVRSALENYVGNIENSFYKEQWDNVFLSFEKKIRRNI